MQAEIDRDLATIAACQKRIERYSNNLTHGREMMEHNEARIAQLRTEIVLEQNKLKIERLLELVDQLNNFVPNEDIESVAACESEEPAETDIDLDDYDPTDEEVSGG